jgi:hypothetical protein
MVSMAEHKLIAWEKYLFGVLNTNLFCGNNTKRTSFSSKTRFCYMATKSQKNSGICCKIAEFCGGISEKTSPRPSNSGWVKEGRNAGPGQKKPCWVFVHLLLPFWILLFQKLPVTATVGPNRDLTKLSKTVGSAVYNRFLYIYNFFGTLGTFFDQQRCVVVELRAQCFMPIRG